MKVEQIILRIVEVPLTYPFETSFGVETTHRTIIVEMKANGISGYGECPSLDQPWYSCETIDVDWLVLTKYMIPMLLGKNIENPQELLNLLGKIRGYNMARASLECAFWDLFTKKQGISLAKALGGIKSKVEAGVSIGIQKEISQLLNLIQVYLDQGYKRIKIKIKHGWDVKVIKTTRETYSDILLMIDANAAYSLDNLPMFKELDKFDLLMIEQPLAYNDLLNHAILQQRIKTSVCLDESIESYSRAKDAIKLKSCKIINIKPPRVGGLIESKKIHDYCQKHNLPVWCGGMLETGIGAAHCVAIASLSNCILPGDISVHSLYSSENLIEPPFKLDPNSTLNVPENPGIGVCINDDELAKLAIKSKVFD